MYAATLFRSRAVGKGLADWFMRECECVCECEWVSLDGLEGGSLAHMDAIMYTTRCSPQGTAQ